MKSGLLFFTPLVLFVSAIEAAQRQPIPDPAARRQASALVKELFADEITKAETPKQKADLVKQFLKQAAESTNDSEGRFALYSEAIELCPDAGEAMSIIDAMARHFEFNVLSAKTSKVVKLSKSARAPEEHKAVAGAAETLIDAYLAEDDFAAASKLGEVAFEAAKKGRDTDLIRAVRARNDEIIKLQRTFRAVESALAVLKDAPTDPAANATVGRYKCLFKGDWQAGLPFLALSDDKVLKRLAADELKSPTDGKQQMALGDGWYDAAQHETGPAKDRLLHRAAYWYAQALPDLTGLFKAKVENRLKELEEITKRYAEESTGVIKSVALSGDKLTKFFKYSGRVRPYAEGGIEFYRGGKSSGRAVSLVKFRPPIEFHIQAFCLPDGAYDFFINILSKVRLNWGNFANRITDIQVGPKKSHVRHKRFKANQLNDIILAIDGQRELTITLNGTVVYKKVVPEDVALEGPLTLHGGQGHTVYKSVTIRKLSPAK